MIRIGLTGGIGSGKSTVLSIFESLNVPCFDTDEAARKVVEPNSPGLAQIESTFGKHLLLNNQLNRAKLRALIFSDPKAKQQLEKILHPLIRQYIISKIESVEAPFCLIEVPLLYETRPDYIDSVIVVDCEEATQIQRTQQRSQLTETEIRNIIRQQATRAQRQSIADWIIDSDQPLTEMTHSVEQVWEQLNAL